ncbi:MAG: PQQ-dependent dehydrogenase, methanol/ethanol family [Acidobacteriota bacterium]|nr:PQQ-dependent dehydrogenase, methanol/ethanol family [Acidobacteriota bacterium]
MHRRFYLLNLVFNVGFAALCTLTAQTNSPGKRAFESQCAVCHGGDGNGGEFAPGIVTRIVNRTDADIGSVIVDGLPNRGMPAFKLNEKDLGDLVGYLRTLRPPRRGDMIPVEVTVDTTDGHKLHGLSLNRTFEDMQLRTADGKIHLLRKEGARYRAVTSQADWPSYDGELKGNRFSPVTQIDKSNVARLTPKWIYSLADSASLETTPLVFEGVMYVTGTNECFALDAGTGREVWHYHRQRTKGMGGKVNRGAAISGGRVFMVTDNAHLIAINRSTGELLWESEMADSRENYAATSAPLIVGDLVVSGIAGGDGGVRGFLAAFDQNTGKEAWRFWTIPGAGEPGSETWHGRNFAHPGGATWFTGSYDAESGALFWQVGNPGPDHNGDEREGDNLYSDSVIALDGKTGKLKWHYQFTPHDEWDWDAAEPLTLVDAPWGGQQRKLLLQANRNGFFYVLDRTNGKLLLGKPFVKKLTWAREIGPNGRPIRNADVAPTEKGTKVCPNVLGAANWWSTAFDPSSGLYYIQAIESCGVYMKRGGDWQAGRGFMGGSSRNAPGEQPQRFLRAIDIKTGKIAWELPQTGSGESRSGTLATASGLVFFGEDSGSFMAADSSTGKVLWHFQTSQSLKASPMTYMFDNKQMVALASGSNILVFGLME